MTVSEQLSEFRETTPHCTLVAFVDLPARMVLAASARVRKPQEELDALGASAADLLEAEALAPGDAPQAAAIVLTSSETRAFVRSADEPGEALCCVGAPGLDVEQVFSKARRFLGDIAGTAEPEPEQDGRAG